MLNLQQSNNIIKTSDLHHDTDHRQSKKCNSARTCYAHVMHMLCTCYAHVMQYAHVMHMLCTCYAHVMHILNTTYAHIDLPDIT